MNAKIGFKIQVTATPGFHSLHDQCFQRMWLLSGAPYDPEDDTVIEKHGAEALYSAVKRLMHAIQTKDKEAQQDAAHQMIQIAKPWTIGLWSEFELANAKALVRIPKENSHLIDPEWTEGGQAHLMTLVERYTLRRASGTWRVHRWRLACFSLVLRDTENRNNVSGQGTMNGHSILGWNLGFSDGWERHFCQSLSTNLQSIPNLTKMTPQKRHSFQKRETKMHCPVHRLHKRQCYYVLFLAKFVIWSSG